MLFKRSRPLIYFAAPLFSEGELTFNLRATKLLERHVDVYLPQRDGGKLVDLVERGVPTSDAYESIFSRDMEAIKEVDALLIVLDGRSIDEGAAFELGVAFSLNKTCVALQTDPRRLLPLGNNPMIQCALHSVHSDLESILEWAKKFEENQISAWPMTR